MTMRTYTTEKLYAAIDRSYREGFVDGAISLYVKLTGEKPKGVPTPKSTDELKGMFR